MINMTNEIKNKLNELFIDDDVYIDDEFIVIQFMKYYYYKFNIVSNIDENEYKNNKIVVDVENNIVDKLDNIISYYNLFDIFDENDIIDENEFIELIIKKINEIDDVNVIFYGIIFNKLYLLRND